MARSKQGGQGHGRPRRRGVSPVRLTRDSASLSSQNGNSTPQRAPETDDEQQDIFPNFNAAQIGVWLDAIPKQIWTCTADGTPDFCNACWRSYTGIELHELLSGKWREILHPDDSERILRIWTESVKKEMPYEMELRMRGVDGKYRWFLARALPMRNAEGRVVRWYGSSSDIEERKQTEDKLKRSETYLAEAQKLSHTGSWAYDAVRRTPIYWSAEWYRISGLDPAEGPSVEKGRALHTPEEWTRLMGVVERAIRDKTDYQTDSFLVLPDGSIKYIQILGHPVVDDSGEVVELVGSVMDVTERKRAEEQLRQISGQLLKLQDEERRTIARDLHDTTGQNLVALTTTLVQLRSSLPSSSRKSRKLISECQALVDQCIREVRTLSYLLHPPMLDRGGIEAAIRHYLDGLAKRSDLHVELEVSQDFGRANPEIELALFKVVQESLTNIKRHSGSRTAHVRLHRDPKEIALEISDIGNGISTFRGKHSGEIPHGVGIPSMRERVNQVGGRLEIESKNRGTRVHVRIPAERA